MGLVQLLRDTGRILVFTGAGISTGSGIRDFRGPKGVWRERQPVYFDDFMNSEGVKPIPSWHSPRLLMAYAAFFFDVVVSIFSSRLNASRSLGRCR